MKLTTIALIAFSLNAQTVVNGNRTVTGYTNMTTGSWRPPEAIVSGLPSASGVTGKVYVVTDGTSAADCTVGSGSTRSLCVSNGTAWVALGGGVVGATGAAGADGKGFFATSSTPFTTAGSGSKSFTTDQSNLAYTVGARIRATATANGDYMEGKVTSYSGSTLVVTMDRNVGTGLHAGWNINPAGDVGAAGAAGSTGATGATGATGGVGNMMYVTFDTAGGTCTVVSGPTGAACTAASTGGHPSGPIVSVTHNFGLASVQVPIGTCGDNSGIGFSLNEGNPLVDIRATSINAMSITFTADAIGNCTLSTGGIGAQGATGPTGPTGPTGASGSGSGDVLGPATNHTGYVPTWNGANSKTLADGIDPATLMTTSTAATLSQLPAASKIRTCVVQIGDPGAASSALADDNDSPVACGNTWSSDWTITSVSCWANAGSPTVTPILTGGSGTSILTGALTCGTASWAAGTVQGTAPIVHSFSANGATCSSTPCTIDANITTAGGTAKLITIRITGTL